MKKLIVLVVVLALVAGLASISSAATPQAIRAYIKLLESKKTTATSNQNWARVNKLNGLLAIEKKRLAAAEAAVAPPPPVAVPPPPPPKKVSMAPADSLFGWGVEVDGSIGYIADKSVLALRGDVLLPDPLAMGPVIGLPEDAVKYRIGLGYTDGDDTNENKFRSIPLFVDGVIMIPADVLGGIESYLGGGLNYLVYRSGQTSGSIGGQVYYGIQGDLGLGAPGKSFAQLGYSVVRTGDDATGTPRSTKGVGVEFGHSMTL